LRQDAASPFLFLFDSQSSFAISLPLLRLAKGKATLICHYPDPQSLAPFVANSLPLSPWFCYGLAKRDTSAFNAITWEAGLFQFTLT